MQVLKYKYRLYPTKEQEQSLLRFCGSQRYIWNHYLAEEQKRYTSDKKFNFYNHNAVDLTTLKKTIEWLQEVPSTSLQQTLRNLDRSLKQSFKKNKDSTKGFPKFKKKQNFSGSFSLTMVNSARNLKGNKFYVNKHLGIDIVLHRELPSDFASCQVKQEGDRWFVVLTCKKAIAEKTIGTKSVGIDLNSKEYVLNNGVRYALPKYLKENQFKIKTLQRRLSRKKNGSKHRREAQLKLYKVHQTVTNKRLDYFNKLSFNLVRDYDTIILEDLDVKGIQKKMGRVIQDNGFSVFRAMIEYKATLYGKETVIIDRYFPSSQLCSQCRAVQKMSLSCRTYECKCCGSIIDRDLNAAINIQRAGAAPDENAFGDSQLVSESVMIGKLIGVSEEGSLRIFSPQVVHLRNKYFNYTKC